MSNTVKYARIDFVQNGFRSDSEVARMSDQQVEELLPAFDDWIASLLED